MGPVVGGWGGICQIKERMRTFQVGNSRAKAEVKRDTRLGS